MHNRKLIIEFVMSHKPRATRNRKSEHRRVVLGRIVEVDLITFIQNKKLKGPLLQKRQMQRIRRKILFQEALTVLVDQPVDSFPKFEGVVLSDSQEQVLG